MDDYALILRQMLYAEASFADAVTDARWDDADKVAEQYFTLATEAAILKLQERNRNDG